MVVVIKAEAAEKKLLTAPHPPMATSAVAEMSDAQCGHQHASSQADKGLAALQSSSSQGMCECMRRLLGMGEDRCVQGNQAHTHTDTHTHTQTHTHAHTHTPNVYAALQGRQVTLNTADCSPTVVGVCGEETAATWVALFTYCGCMGEYCGL